MSKKRPGDFKCDLCPKIFPTNHGLSIHTGKVHKEESEINTPIKKRKHNDEGTSEEIARKKINLKKIPEGVSECENCGGKFTYVKSFNWHIKNCNRKKKELQESVVLTPAKEQTQIIDNKVVYKSCPECDHIIEAEDFKSLLESMKSHNSICNIKIVTELADDKTTDDTDINELVHKVKELDVDDEILKSPKEGMSSCQCNQCGFKTNNSLELEKHNSLQHTVRDPSMIPERLETLFAMKGIGIKEHQVIQAGGGGMCGANCISLHTCGNQEMGQDIRENTNEHLVQNWGIYRDSYEFPYTERVGVGSKCKI